MNHRITALLPLLLPIAAALGGCSSMKHPGPFKATSALTAPSLGAAENFAVLAGQAVTNTGPTTVEGNVGVSPGSAVTGFPPGLVSGGTLHAADAVALMAQGGVTTAYVALAGEACTSDKTGIDLGGLTLTQGVYCFSSEAQLTGTLTLDAEGKSDAVFVFQIASKLTTASNAAVRVINGGTNCRVFWQVGSSATIGTNTTFVGNILALTSIALQTGAHLDGRALARNGAVTMDDDVVALASCAANGDAGPGDASSQDTGQSDAPTSKDTSVDTAPPCDDQESPCF